MQKFQEEKQLKKRIFLEHTPEPAFIALLGAGMGFAAALANMRRRRNQEKDEYGARRNPENL